MHRYSHLDAATVESWRASDAVHGVEEFGPWEVFRVFVIPGLDDS